MGGGARGVNCCAATRYKSTAPAAALRRSTRQKAAREACESGADAARRRHARALTSSSSPSPSSFYSSSSSSRPLFYRHQLAARPADTRAPTRKQQAISANSQFGPTLAGPNSIGLRRAEGARDSRRTRAVSGPREVWESRRWSSARAHSTGSERARSQSGSGSPFGLSAGGGGVPLLLLLLVVVVVARPTRPKAWDNEPVGVGGEAWRPPGASLSCSPSSSSSCKARRSGPSNCCLNAPASRGESKVLTRRRNRRARDSRQLPRARRSLLCAGRALALQLASAQQMEPGRPAALTTCCAPADRPLFQLQLQHHRQQSTSAFRRI